MKLSFWKIFWKSKKETIPETSKSKIKRWHFRLAHFFRAFWAIYVSLIFTKKNLDTLCPATYVAAEDPLRPLEAHRALQPYRLRRQRWVRQRRGSGQHLEAGQVLLQGLDLILRGRGGHCVKTFVLLFSLAGRRCKSLESCCRGGD